MTTKRTDAEERIRTLETCLRELVPLADILRTQPEFFSETDHFNLGIAIKSARSALVEPTKGASK